MSKHLLMTLIASFALLFTTTAAAQTAGGGTSEPRNALQAGTASLSFSVPSGGNPYAPGTAGLWYLVAPNINVGLNVGIGVDSTTQIQNFNVDGADEERESRTAIDFLLAPALKFYTNTRGTVTPYFLGQLNLHKFSDGDVDTVTDPADDDNTFNSSEQPEVGLVAGFGLEWFPVGRFSIGGHIGLGIDLVRQDSLNGTTLNETGFAVGTFTSALTANLYF